MLMDKLSIHSQSERRVVKVEGLELLLSQSIQLLTQQTFANGAQIIKNKASTKVLTYSVSDISLLTDLFIQSIFQ